MRIVVRTAAGNIHQLDVQISQQRKESHWLAQIILFGILIVYAEAPTVRQVFPICFWNSDAHLSGHATSWIRVKGHNIEGRNTHPDLQARRDGANAFRHFAQESGAVFKTSAVITLASMCAQKLVAEISMTVLNVNELETKLVRELRRALKVVNDSSDLAISKNGIALIDTDASIEKRMMVKNSAVQVSPSHSVD